MCFLAFFPGGREEVEEGVGLLELQCTFIWVDNQKKKFFTSNSVKALIVFYEEHQGLLKMQVPLGWEWERTKWGGKGGAISKRGNYGAGSC